jgi:acetyltransferase-like isoleucine patch superfamily enzyme
MSVARLVKQCLFAAAVLVVWPLWMMAWLERRLGVGEEAFLFGAQLLAWMPGLPGAFLRSAYYVGTLERCHWEVRVGFGSIFVKRAASMARHASMGNYCVIGNADIGEGVMIGSRVSVPSGKRQHFDEAGRLSAKAENFDRVRIGARSWIGEGAIVMSDVGEHSVVGAGAVVVNRVGDRLLVSGNPAQTVRPVDVDSSAVQGSA